VVRLASDERWFTYLAQSEAETVVIEGDARISLASECAQGTGPRFDFLIVDAFSSDAIPVHLLTREALALYLAKLAPGGVIALHISNRNLDLAPIVADLVADAGVVGWQRTFAPPDAALRGYRGASSWVAIRSVRSSVR